MIYVLYEVRCLIYWLLFRNEVHLRKIFRDRLVIMKVSQKLYDISLC